MRSWLSIAGPGPVTLVAILTLAALAVGWTLSARIQ